MLPWRTARQKLLRSGVRCADIWRHFSPLSRPWCTTHCLMSAFSDRQHQKARMKKNEYFSNRSWYHFVAFRRSANNAWLWLCWKTAYIPQTAHNPPLRTFLRPTFAGLLLSVGAQISKSFSHIFACGAGKGRCPLDDLRDSLSSEFFLNKSVMRHQRKKKETEGEKNEKWVETAATLLRLLLILISWI